MLELRAGLYKRSVHEHVLGCITLSWNILET